jgi:hypothetical protein
MHRPRRESMTFSSRNHVDVHREIKIDGRPQEVLEQRARVWHRREVAYPKDAEKFFRRS